MFISSLSLAGSKLKNAFVTPMGKMNVRCYNFHSATPWANSQPCHTTFLYKLCLAVACSRVASLPGPGLSANMLTVFNRFRSPLTCFRSVGAGSCSLSSPVYVSNSRLNARGRHHGIALSRDESFFKILGKPFPLLPFRFLAFLFWCPPRWSNLCPSIVITLLSQKRM